MAQPLKVLVVEDNAEDAELLLRELRRAGYAPEAQQVDNEEKYLALLREGFDLVLSDFRMPRFSGIRALELLRARGYNLPFILVSGTIGEDTAVEAMKLGASDYLLKDRLGRLGQAVAQALVTNRLRLEHRRTEEKLRASEKLFRSTLENMMEGCQIIGRDWRYIYVNEIAAGHAQKPAAQLIGRTMPEVFPGIEKTELFATLQACLADSTPREMNNKFIYSSGASAWFHLFIQPVPEGLFILSLDITARKQVEDALRASEARFREMLQNVELIAVTLDPSGQVTFCNDYLLRLTGWERNEVMGANWFAKFLPQTGSEAARRFHETIAAGAIPRHHEDPIKTKQGELREIAWNNTLLRDALGFIRGVASIGEDITERKQAAEKIRGQLDELRRWHDVTLGREERIIALKAEVNQLLAEQKKPPRYAAAPTA